MSAFQQQAFTKRKATRSVLLGKSISLHLRIFNPVSGKQKRAGKMID